MEAIARMASRFATALLSGLVVAISGCSTPPPISMEEERDDVGYVVAGIGSTSPAGFMHHWLVMKRGDRSEMFPIWYSPGSLLQKKDYANELEAGYVGVVPLLPGHYVLVNFQTESNDGVVRSTLRLRRDFFVPFEVRAKEITYLGNYQANVIWKRSTGLFDVSIPDGFFVVVEDRAAADVATARKKYASLPPTPLHNLTPDPLRLGNPVVLSPAEAVSARKVARAALEKKGSKEKQQ